ncbi:hypothetical protein HMPREF1548_02466 [Clostridium sp. KLE 1755]|nr:hypothetical protein HMPREF1548_02466 [Clostridium sp. KLE 1755]
MEGLRKERMPISAVKGAVFIMHGGCGIFLHIILVRQVSSPE